MFVSWLRIVFMLLWGSTSTIASTNIFFVLKTQVAFFPRRCKKHWIVPTWLTSAVATVTPEKKIYWSSRPVKNIFFHYFLPKKNKKKKFSVPHQSYVLLLQQTVLTFHHVAKKKSLSVCKTLNKKNRREWKEKVRRRKWRQKAIFYSLFLWTFSHAQGFPFDAEGRTCIKNKIYTWCIQVIYLFCSILFSRTTLIAHKREDENLCWTV